MPRYLVATAKDLGELIRGFRKQRGWTQARLAERAGLLPKTVSAIEAGGGHVLLANVMRCLSALDVDLSLDARSGTRTMLEPKPPINEAAAPPLPVKQSRKPPQSSTASRTLSDAKALKENW